MEKLRLQDSIYVNYSSSLILQLEITKLKVQYKIVISDLQIAKIFPIFSIIPKFFKYFNMQFFKLIINIELKKQIYNNYILKALKYYKIMKFLKSKIKLIEKQYIKYKNKIRNFRIYKIVNYNNKIIQTYDMFDTISKYLNYNDQNKIFLLNSQQYKQQDLFEWKSQKLTLSNMKELTHFQTRFQNYSNLSELNLSQVRLLMSTNLSQIKNIKLKKLILDGTEINFKIFKDLFGILDHNLQSENYIPKGISDFNSQLKYNRQFNQIPLMHSLDQLSVKECRQLGSECIKVLVLIQNLKHLDMTGVVNINDEFFKLVSDCKDWIKWTYLNIDGSRVGLEAVEVISTLPQLNRLSMNQCFVTDHLENQTRIQTLCKHLVLEMDNPWINFTIVPTLQSMLPKFDTPDYKARYDISVKRIKNQISSKIKSSQYIDIDLNEIVVIYNNYVLENYILISKLQKSQNDYNKYVVNKKRTKIKGHFYNQVYFMNSEDYNFYQCSNQEINIWNKLLRMKRHISNDILI